MDIETRLRQDLAIRAQDVTAAPPGFADAVIEGHRAQRRNRAGLLAVAAAVVAVAVAVPLALQGSGGGQTATPSSSPTTAVAQPSGPVVPYQRYDLPPRGSLAGDAGYLQGLLDRPWDLRDSTDQVVPDPAAETRQVVFAGEVPGGVQALVVGEQDGGLVGTWLDGPAGASPADLEFTHEPGPVDLSGPVVSTHTEGGVGALVVIGRPGDVIEVSTGQTVDAEGTLARSPFRTVGDEAGIAVVDAGGLSQRTTEVRVTRDGIGIEPTGEWGSSDGPQAEPDLTDAFAGATGAPDASLVRMLVQTLPDELGTAAADLQVRVLWGGSIGIRQQPDAEAVVVTVRLPSGAVLLMGGRGDHRAGESDGGGFTSGGLCARALLPAGADVASTGVAMVCPLYDPQGADGELGRQLVVLPPAGTADLQATDAAGGVLESYDFFGDALVVPAPEGVAGVTAQDAGGAVLAEIRVTGQQSLRAD